MKFFKFSDYIGHDYTSFSVPIIHKKFEVFDVASITLSSLVIPKIYSYQELGKYAIDQDRFLYIWNGELELYERTSVVCPEDAIFMGKVKSNYLFTKGIRKQELYLIDEKTSKISLKLSYRGFCVFFEEDSFVIELGRCKGVESRSFGNDLLWTLEEDIDSLMVVKGKSQAFLVSQDKLLLLDLKTSEIEFSTSCNKSINSVHTEGAVSYLFFDSLMWIFDHEQKLVVNKMDLPIERNFTFYQNYLFIADRYRHTISCYDKTSLKLLKEQKLIDNFLFGGGCIIHDDVMMFSCSSENYLNRHGKSHVAVISLDEFFSDNFQQEIEPDYFEVHEEADIEGGNNLRITLDTSINFDTLYRHLSVALQNIPFRHGNYGWAATLDEEKPVNENFNGKVIADLSDHVFTPEQRDLLEEVIQEAMEFYANRQITSGDGKGTPCYVVSVIPVAE